MLNRFFTFFVLEPKLRSELYDTRRLPYLRVLMVSLANFSPGARQQSSTASELPPSASEHEMTYCE